MKKESFEVEKKYIFTKDVLINGYDSDNGVTFPTGTVIVFLNRDEYVCHFKVEGTKIYIDIDSFCQMIMDEIEPFTATEFLFVNVNLAGRFAGRFGI